MNNAGNEMPETKTNRFSVVGVLQTVAATLLAGAIAWFASAVSVYRAELDDIQSEHSLWEYRLNQLQQFADRGKRFTADDGAELEKKINDLAREFRTHEKWGLGRIPAWESKLQKLESCCEENRRAVNRPWMHLDDRVPRSSNGNGR